LLITRGIFPKAIAATALMEVYLPIMAVLALVASLRISPPGHQAAAFAAVALGLLSVVRTADVARHWSRGAEDVAAVRRALAVVPPHSYVLLVVPPNDKIAVPESILASVHALSDPDYELSPSQHYVRHWRDRFDYALVVNADLPDQRGPVTLLAGVEMVADEGFVQVLRLPRGRRLELSAPPSR
jgi:hypothetical protein